MDARNVTANPERYCLYRLCECTACAGSGKERVWVSRPIPGGFMDGGRCADCRGEGRTRDLIATCATPEAIGVALVTLGREGEWEGCPIGILDTEGEKGEKWLVRPWTPSARNVSDAARTLAKSKLVAGAGTGVPLGTLRDSVKRAADAEKQAIIDAREKT